MVKKKVKKSPTKRKTNKKDEVCEIFEVNKDGKEKVIEVCGVDKNKGINLTKKEVEYQNKQLKWILLVLGILVVAFLGGYYIIKSSSHFNYRGVGFDIVDEIAPYRTSIPVMYNGQIVPYNFYLRNDPRKLDEIWFNGNINLEKNMVINSTDEFNCDGDGIIGLANLLNQYKVVGINVIKDDSAGCDEQGNYMFLKIQKSDENMDTSITQFGPSCYRMEVNNCEILKATERFMIETFVEINKEISEKTN